MAPLRLAFLGTPEASVPPLQALVAEGHDVALVVTQPDRRRGRGGGLVSSPVKAAATAAGIRVSERVEDVMDAGVDLGVVVAFGRLVKPHVLERVPMVNLHFSLLPRWRGAAPVERAILAGDTETGVCLMAVEAGLDTGPVHRCERVAIGADETAAELRGRLVELGTAMLVDELGRGLGRPVPQVGEAIYAAKLEPDELRLDWARPATELHRVVRLGRAWTTFGGRRLRVRKAAVAGSGPEPGLLQGVVVGTGDGRGLALVEVQPEGRGPMTAADWLRGVRPEGRGAFLE
ncbi:MAG: methionyl-tRNA formyltransferase [Actinomycetota bacterium]|nr:methionyl-tRNA formyltransferase [Actinomycetota bacterium]MDQ3679308.1 methionyl-tRNA formyltransferase [Actinomycetota bacterium]